MRSNVLQSPSVDASLANAERLGFRLAVIGRTCALVPIAAFYGATYGYPQNIYIAGLILATAAIGVVPLSFVVGSRYERIGRYAFFAFDIAVLSARLPPSRPSAVAAISLRIWSLTPAAAITISSS